MNRTFTERDAMRFYAAASNTALAGIQLRIAHFARLATQGLAKADMRKLVESLYPEWFIQANQDEANGIALP